MKKHLDDYAEHLLCSALRESSVTQYLSEARLFLDFAGTVTAETTRRYFEALRGNVAVATYNNKASAVSIFQAYLVGVGAIPKNYTSTIAKQKRSEVGPASLSRNEVNAVLRELPRHDKWVQLVVHLLLCGLRVKVEAMSLSVEDIEVGKRKGSIKVRNGKGGGQRTVPMTTTCFRFFRDNETWPGLLDKAKSVTYRTVYNRVKQLPGNPHPHMLRHTYARNLIDNGTPLGDVATLLGHSSLDSTLIYTRPDQTALEGSTSKMDW